jgi:hypothetical protein
VCSAASGVQRRRWSFAQVFVSCNCLIKCNFNEATMKFVQELGWFVFAVHKAINPNNYLFPANSPDYPNDFGSNISLCNSCIIKIGSVVSPLRMIFSTPSEPRSVFGCTADRLHHFNRANPTRTTSLQHNQRNEAAN